ncbi:hypothetical protein [Brachybacterium sp. GPGPB12]|uniref:hypothetical protein n=1 Tax=Brachybacterium sp. GPGPB12 TaxID=3023517 RepID=UPI0031343AB7
MSGEDGRSPEPRDVDAEFARMLCATRGSRSAPAGRRASRPRRRTRTAPAASPPRRTRTGRRPRRACRSPADVPGRRIPRGGRGTPRRASWTTTRCSTATSTRRTRTSPSPPPRCCGRGPRPLGGFGLLLAVTLSASLPSVLGWAGGAAALGGMVSLLLRSPRRPRDEGDDGAEV